MDFANLFSLEISERVRTDVSTFGGFVSTVGENIICGNFLLGSKTHQAILATLWRGLQFGSRVRLGERFGFGKSPCSYWADMNGKTLSEFEIKMATLLKNT